VCHAALPNGGGSRIDPVVWGGVAGLAMADGRFTGGGGNRGGEERERREVFTGAAGAAAIPLERAHLLSHVRALVRRTCVAVPRC
jgi:hypothetical protein